MARIDNIKDSIVKLPGQAEETMDKIRSNPKATTAATVMQVTGSVLLTLSKVGVPVVGYVAGALKIGSGILDPKPKLSDIRKKSDELKEVMMSSSETVREALRNEVAKLDDEIKKEMELLLLEQKREIQNYFKESLTDEMKSLDASLSDLKDVIHLTFEVVLDARYRQAIELVESAFHNFVAGSHNLERTLHLYANYIAELQTVAITSLSPKNIEM